MRTTNRVSMVMAAAAMVIVWAVPGRAEAWTIGLGGQLYGDDGEIDGVKRVGPQAPQRQDRQFYADNTASVALWALTALSETSRYGGGIRFYGGYGLIDNGAEENVAEGEEVPVYDLGTMADLYGQLEWLLPVLEGDHELDFIIGGQAGISVLFPGEGLDAEITSEQEDGASVTSLPRLGALFGPQVGVRYMILADRLAVRVDGGVRFGRLWLFDTEEEIEGVAYQKEWHADILRYEVGLGLELSF